MIEFKLNSMGCPVHLDGSELTVAEYRELYFPKSKIILQKFGLDGKHFRVIEGVELDPWTDLQGIPERG